MGLKNFDADSCGTSNVVLLDIAAPLKKQTLGWMHMFLRSWRFNPKEFSVCHMSYDINDINSGDAKPDFAFHKSGDCSQQV